MPSRRMSVAIYGLAESTADAAAKDIAILKAVLAAELTSSVK